MLEAGDEKILPGKLKVEKQEMYAFVSNRNRVFIFIETNNGSQLASCRARLEDCEWASGTEQKIQHLIENKQPDVIQIHFWTMKIFQ